MGVAIAVFDLMAFGASVQNLGGDLGGGASLTRRTRAGLTMNYVDPQGAYRLLTTLEGQWPAGGAAAFLIVGVEGGVVTRGTGIVGRVGYAGHSVSTDASPFSYGAGHWFEAPLAFLLDHANQARRSALFEGRERHYYEIDWNGRRVPGIRRPERLHTSLHGLDEVRVGRTQIGPRRSPGVVRKGRGRGGSPRPRCPTTTTTIP